MAGNDLDHVIGNFVGRNKASEARSARWRYSGEFGEFAGNADSRFRSNLFRPTS